MQKDFLLAYFKISKILKCRKRFDILLQFYGAPRACLAVGGQSPWLSLRVYDSLSPTLTGLRPGGSRGLLVQLEDFMLPSPLWPLIRLIFLSAQILSADNPDKYGEIIEENFPISYESG